MAKIPVWQRRKLASSLVGTPGIDTSSSEALHAVAKATGHTAEAGLHVLAQKQEVEDTAKVNKSIIDFEIAAGDQLLQHQQSYEADPENKTDLFIENLQELSTTFSEGITNTRARLAFTRMSQNSIRQKAQQEMTWAYNQRADNAVADIVTSQNNLSTEAYRIGTQDGSLNEFDDLLNKFTGTAVASRSILPKDKFDKLLIEGPKAIARAYIDGKSKGNVVDAMRLMDQKAFDAIFDGEELGQLEKRIIENFNRYDAIAEKALDDIQERNRFTFFTRIVKGGDGLPTLDEIGTAVDQSRLSGSDGEDLIQILQDPPPIETNPYIYTELNTALTNGTLTIKDIMDNARGLDTATRETLIDQLTAKIATNPAVKQAVATWDAQFQEEAFGVRNLIDERDYNAGVQEIYRRSLQGKENPFEVVDEMIKRRNQQKSLEEVSVIKRRLKRKLGPKVTKKKIDEYRKELRERDRLGTISEETALEEAQALEELEREINA